MKQIDIAYYEWLTAQIAIPSGKTYHYLFERMHNMEFIWTVPHDANRLRDGIDLRTEFLDGRAHRLTLDVATALEVLIGLSRRVAFNAGGNEKRWAWLLIKNLKLNRMSDPVSSENATRIENILEALIWRTYRSDGSGGFFPLKDPTDDQTKVEIWYQMQAYIREM
jgi:hypothetical protein